MDTLIKCKNCGKDASRSVYMGEGGFVDEERIKCICGYWSEFLYGYSSEQFPDKPEMAWSHLDPVPREVKYDNASSQP